MTLDIKHIYKSFQNETTVNKVLEDITFSTNQGEFLSILGQSGCGKSTLLRIIGGNNLKNPTMVGSTRTAIK